MSDLGSWRVLVRNVDDDAIASWPGEWLPWAVSEDGPPISRKVKGVLDWTKDTALAMTCIS